MATNTKKTYSQTSHKIRENWEDTQRLIALHNQVLQQIIILNDKVDRLWNIVQQTRAGVE